MTRKVIRRPR